MSQSQRRFVTFGISHYCEKARWALDWHGIAYEEINWPPGVHIILAKSCGAKQTSLPILLDGRTVIQGSGAIIDWADQEAQEPARQLTVADAREIEQRADSVIGAHVRRLVYAELLPRYPELANAHRLAANAKWPLSRRIMMRMHDITPDAAAESRAQFWNRSLTGSTARSPTTAATSQETASAAPTSRWPAYWPFLPDPKGCRHTGRCPSLRLSLPTANAGAIGR